MTASSGENPDIQELAAWYVAIGVDIALEEQPVDRFAQSAVIKEKRKQARDTAKTALETKSAGRQTATTSNKPSSAFGFDNARIPDEQAVADARSLASAAINLDQLRQALADFDGCNLRHSARNLVFADGDPQAKIMLIGEAPGREEDSQGLPFVGRSGMLLERMLGAIGLKREDVYITNVIPWRPPGNRTPTPIETELCRPFIERHIQLMDPKLVVVLGGAAAKALLKTTDGILKLRGRWAKITIADRQFRAMPTLHPAYLLRQPAQKKLAWQDLIKIHQSLAQD